MRTRIVAATAALTLAPTWAAAQQPSGPIAESATELRTAEVPISTGIRVRFTVQGDPAGPAVVLLHGYSDSLYSWSRILPLLPAGWSVHALDLRGHGGTDKPETGYTAGEMARDVLAFMDARGVERATIVAHSGGGLIAQQLMAIAPERVERAVIVASITTGRNVTGIEEIRAAVTALGEPVDPGFVRAFQESTVAVPVPSAFMDRVVAESLKMPARAWQAYLAGVLDTEPVEALRSTRIPTLLVWGDRDAVVPRSEQDALLDLIPGSSLIVYEGIGHAPNWEAPERFVADLTAFVEAPRG